jgi:hypothetical protein
MNSDEMELKEELPAPGGLQGWEWEIGWPGRDEAMNVCRSLPNGWILAEEEAFLGAPPCVEGCDVRFRRVAVEDLEGAAESVVNRRLVLSIHCHAVQVRQQRVGVCPHELECGNGVNSPKGWAIGPACQCLGERLTVLGVQVVDPGAPLGRSGESPFQQMGQGVCAHVEEGIGLRLGVCLHDPLAEFESLVGGFWIAAGESKEDDRGQGDARHDQGEFLPVSPHEGSVT